MRMSAAVMASRSPVMVIGGRDGKAGKELRVLAGVENLAGKLGSVSPERDLVAPAAVEGERDSGSPGAGT